VRKLRTKKVTKYGHELEHNQLWTHKG